MRARITGFAAIVALITTIIWLILLVLGQIATGSPENFPQVLAHISRPNTLYTLTYLNAALSVLTATALFGGLYVITRPISPQLAAMGLAFVPIYAVLNLVVYLSQLTLVPYLLTLRIDPAQRLVAEVLLEILVQQWPASPMAFFNNLGYAILGIPSVLFGLLLVNRHPRLRVGGILLALNGVACLLGIVGQLAGIGWLRNGSLVGGVLFLAALPFLAFHLLRKT